MSPIADRFKLHEPVWKWSFVAALAAVELVYFMFSVGTPDTARDIVQASRICDGTEFPMIGPMLGGQHHLGPYWFYLIAPFSCTSNPLLGVGLAAGVVSALKYPLAYILGRRLFSEQFAILWIAILAFISWPTALILYTHTSAVLTHLLLAALALATWVNKRVVLSAFLFGFCTSLAINLHPSAFPFALLAVIPMWRAWRENRVIATLLAGLAGGLIPFLPLVFAMLGTRGAQTEGPASGVLLVSLESIMNIPRYLWLALTGSVDSATALLSRLGLPAGLLWGMFVALCGLALAGAARLYLDRASQVRTVSWVLALLAFLLWVALAITSIRTFFPFYMLFIGVLPLSALLALLLAQLRDRPRWTAILLSALLAAIPVVTFVGNTGDPDLKVPVKEFTNFESALMQEANMPYFLWVSVGEFSDSAELVCEAGTDRLHGYIRLQVNESLGLLSRDCPAQPSRQRQRSLMIYNAVSDLIGRVPDQAARISGLYRVKAVSGEAEFPPPTMSYPHYPSVRNMVERELTISAQAGDYLFLSNPHITYPMEVTQVQVSGGEAVILYQDRFATIMKCDGCQDQAVQWRVGVKAGINFPIDLVAF